MFSNDQLRYEVKEDMLVSELVLPEDLAVKGINVPHVLSEFESRLTSRVNELLSTKRPIILDGSVDRRWHERKDQLSKYGYSWFMINMELSFRFLEHLYNSTGRSSFVPQLHGYFEQHEQFVAQHGSDINLSITDKTFKDRLAISEKSLSKFLKALDKA